MDLRVDTLTRAFAQGIDLFARARAGAFYDMDARIGDNVEEIRRVAEVRIVMERARAAAIPYSEARRRWDNADDIAMEIAYDAVLASESFESCPDCGTKYGDQLAENGRPLTHPKWKFVVHHCFQCEAQQELQEQLNKQTKQHAAPGDEHPFTPKIRMKPYRLGDDTIPDVYPRHRDDS